MCEFVYDCVSVSWNMCEGLSMSVCQYACVRVYMCLGVSVCERWCEFVWVRV